MPLWDYDYTKTFHHSSYPAISPTRPELSAAGKTVFISGGNRGLGTGIVHAFAQAGAARIVVLARNAQTLEAVKKDVEAANPKTKVIAVVGDVSKEADVARAFQEAGPVDVVVANAGFFASAVPVAPANEVKEDGLATADDDFGVEWWRGFEVNVKGVLLQARHFLASAATPDAVFINTSAGGCHLNPPILGFSSYASSKLATARVVETLQAENPGLRFFNVQPGVIHTDMLAQSGIDKLPDVPFDDLDLPGHFMVWLASQEATWLRGKFLWANWDVDELQARKEEILTGHKLVTGLVGWE